MPREGPGRAPTMIAIPRLLLVAAVYGAAGAVTVLFSLRFAIPSPVFLPAGVAAGAVLVWGPGVAPAVFLGRVLLSLLTGGTFGPAPYTLLFELWLAAAVTVQALAGGLLARRFLKADPGLSTDATAVWLVAVVGPATCWLAPALGMPALQLEGRMPSTDIAFTFYRWWASDSLGALLLAPVFVPLFGRPSHVWRERRAAVLAPLLVTAVLMTAVLFASSNWERRRVENQFDADVRMQTDAFTSAVHQLDAVASALTGQVRQIPVDTDLVSRARLVRPLQALLPEGASLHWLAKPAPQDADLQLLLQKANAGQLVESMLRLRDQPELVWAIPGDGAVYFTVPLEQLLQALRMRFPSQRCLMLSQDSSLRRLAGDADCGASRRRLQRDVPVTVGGKPLTLRVTALPDYAVQNRTSSTWSVYALALLGSAFLVAFIFTVSGRASRIRELVDQRTQALQASEARLQSLFDAALVGILYVGLDGRIERMNPEGARIAGCDNRPCEGKLMLLDFVLPALRDEIAPLFAAVVRGDTNGWTRELTLVRCDGEQIPVLLRLAASQGTNGRPLHLVAVMVDLTEIRKLQAAEHAREVAEVANRSKNDFLARMSHELRTPLNAILGFAQLLRESCKADPSAQDRLSHVERAGWHLLSMINDVLDVSRLETGQIALEMEPVPLLRALRDAAALVQDAARQRDVTMSVEAVGTDVAVMADATRLQQVLLNLLSNAVKYNRRGGRVQVTLTKEAGEVGVAVQDTGQGLTAEQIGNLFVPFNRLGQERSATPGTGLGLVIARQLAHAMGGHLDVHSVPGAGATFTLWLKLAQAAVDAGVQHGGAAESADCLEGQVLYVEDNEVNVEVMRAVLAHEPNLHMKTCATGAAALQIVASGGIDLVLLDLGLPDMDGHEVLAQLLRMDPKLAVIVVSADASSAAEAKALSGGARACLPKPFDIARLRDLVSRTIHRHGEM